jgi:1,4-dihydroxy-2-naphthoate octaprenyltransferase
VAIGIKKARVYHVALILAAFVFSAIYILISAPQSWLWLCMLTFALFIRHLKKTSSFTDAKELFPELGKLAIATFLFALTFSIGLILS